MDEHRQAAAALARMCTAHRTARPECMLLRLPHAPLPRTLHKAAVRGQHRLQALDHLGHLAAALRVAQRRLALAHRHACSGGSGRGGCLECGQAQGSSQAVQPAGL